MQLILVSGHLIEFHITGTSLHHRRKGIVHLLDAYVCSGYLAAQHLPKGQYHPDDPPLPRRYMDGLESDDLEEDTMFMVWWHLSSSSSSTSAAASSGASSKSKEKVSESKSPESRVPGLAKKRKISVYRTRSKLERDAWVWAIKSEIEKAVRASKEREEKVRQAGNLVED